MAVTREERLKFADALMEEAEHSSEIAMRTSLSRAYYALHHLGIEVTGVASHGAIEKRLSELDESLGEEYGYFHRERSRADYTPPLLSGFALEELRERFRTDMVRARVLLERLRGEL